MKSLITKSVFASCLALGALLAASGAHARSNVDVSIGFHLPFGYVQPAPVYVQPAPVYVQPAPVYVQPAPVYAHPQTVYYGDHRGHHRHGHRGWGDADRDGVPNRYDRRPHNPYRY